jgi:hypothetical protein
MKTAKRNFGGVKRICQTRISRQIFQADIHAMVQKIRGSAAKARLRFHCPARWSRAKFVIWLAA